MSQTRGRGNQGNQIESKPLWVVPSKNNDIHDIMCHLKVGACDYNNHWGILVNNVPTHF